MTASCPPRLQLGGPISTVASCAAADTRLKPTDIMVLVILGQVQSTDVQARRQGWFSLSQGVLAALMPYERAAVNKSIKRLTDALYLNRRHQKNGFGGDAPCLYQINYNVVLPIEFDRWQGLQHLLDKLQESAQMAGDSSGNTPDLEGTPPESFGNTPPLSGAKHGVPQGTPPESPGNTPVCPESHGVEKSAETIGVPQGTGGVPSESDSSDFYKRIGESDSETEKCEVIIEMFLACRTKWWPTARQAYPNHILLEQIGSYIDAGLSHLDVAKVTFDNMLNAARRAYEAPSGFKMFRKNFEKALKDQGLSLHTPTIGLSTHTLIDVPIEQLNAWEEVFKVACRQDNSIQA